MEIFEKTDGDAETWHFSWQFTIEKKEEQTDQMVKVNAELEERKAFEKFHFNFSRRRWQNSS